MKKKSKGITAPLIDDLYKAAQAYVEGNGGKLAVIGGIQILQDDPTRKLNFGVVIRCTGKLPTFCQEQPAGVAHQSSEPRS